MAWYWSSVLLLGMLVTIGGLLSSRLIGDKGAAGPPLWKNLLAGLGLTALAFAVCLPTRAPFSPGGHMGYGVLLGAAAALVALLVHRASRPASDTGSRACTAAAVAGVAVVWVAITQAIFRADPQYALLGGMIGAFLVVTPLLWSKAAVSIMVFPLAVAVFGFGSLLGEARYPLAPERPYWPLATLPAAAGLLGVVVGALILGRTRVARWRIAAVAVVLAAAGCLLNRGLLFRYEHIDLGLEFTSLVLLGWFTFALAAATAESTPNRRFGVVAPILLAVTALLLSFNILGGYGASVMLAAGIPLALALAPKADDGRRPLDWYLCLGIIYLAYRLYVSHFGDWFRAGPALEFGRHYVLVGLAAGVLWMGGIHSVRRSAASLVVHLAALALLPAVLFSALGPEALLGLLIGLWVTQLATPLWSEGRAPGFDLPATVPMLIAVWALVLPRWGEFMLDQPRLTRGLVIGLAAAAILMALALLGRAEAGGQSRPAAEG